MIFYDFQFHGWLEFETINFVVSPTFVLLAMSQSLVNEKKLYSLLTVFLLLRSDWSYG